MRVEKRKKSIAMAATECDIAALQAAVRRLEELVAPGYEIYAIEPKFFGEGSLKMSEWNGAGSTTVTIKGGIFVICEYRRRYWRS